MLDQQPLIESSPSTDSAVRESILADRVYTAGLRLRKAWTRDAVREVLAVAEELAMLSYTRQSEPLTSPSASRDFVRSVLLGKEHEVFCVIFLDTRHRVIEFRQMFNGTIAAAHVHPREVVKAALELNAAAVILAHNHPSGVSEPSAADLAITRRLRDALALVDIRTLDHLIVGERDVVSLAERGMI